MNNNTLVFATKAKAVREEALRRRAQAAEFKALCSAGAMVFSGLLLAAAYCLLSGRISA